MLACRWQRVVDAESQTASPLCLVQDPSTTPVNLFWIVSRRQLDALLLVLNYSDQRNSREKVLILGHTSKQSPSWWTVRAAGAQSVCSHVMSTSGKGKNEYIYLCSAQPLPFYTVPDPTPTSAVKTLLPGQSQFCQSDS